MADKLYDLKIYKYQITLDGFAQTHDKQRVLRNGDKTFWSIVNNIIDVSGNFIKNSLALQF